MKIELEDVWRVYRVGDQDIEAVRGVALQVQRGEFVCVIGHSGSGKSTLLSMIGGLARPTRGRIALDGVEPWQRDDRYRAALRNERIGFVFQFASLIPTLTAIDNVALPSLFSGARGARQVEAEAAALLERVGLAEKFTALPGELSGGQQRRVAIARALLNRPQLILADEPTGDLDEDTEAEAIALLRGSAREFGAAFVMVTHNRAIARGADRVLEMKGGMLQ
ncbi:MAG: ABC transporter ATP-binding protein [Burkholderiaceae bacterium]